MEANKPQVLVRTFGDYPCVRVLWEIEGRVAVVVEPDHLADVEAGDPSWTVAVALDDVFVLENGFTVDQRRPFSGWDSLKRVAA